MNNPASLKLNKSVLCLTNEEKLQNLYNINNRKLILSIEWQIFSDNFFFQKKFMLFS